MSDTATGTEGTEPATGNESGASTEETEAPTIKQLQAEIEDLKGHSRKWEDRAKENFEAKKELDKVRREGMSDAERRQADLTDAQNRADAAETRAAKAEAALARRDIAAEFELSADDAKALDSIEDEDTLRKLAERLSGRSNGPRPNPAQGRTRSTTKTSSQDAFVDVLEELLG